MSAIAPVAASSFAPEERPQQLKAKESRRTGRHEPIRSSTTRIATRGAGLGVTLAAGVATGINYLEHDLQLSLLAGAQAGSVAAGMAFVGAWAERRRMTRIARAAADLAVQLTADGTSEDGAAARLLALRGADRVALEQAARRTAGNPDGGRALGSSAAWPCSAPCCSRQLEFRHARCAGHPRGAGAGPRAPGRPL